MVHLLYEPLDFLGFWRVNIGEFPIIAQIARWLLVIAISSAEVERLFPAGAWFSHRVAIAFVL